jgi:hypothetical protein
LPEQWLHEPTIRRGADEHVLNEHLCFFFFGAGTGAVSVAESTGETESLLIRIMMTSSAIPKSSNKFVAGDNFSPLKMSLKSLGSLIPAGQFSLMKVDSCEIEQSFASTEKEVSVDNLIVICILILVSRYREFTRY